jgi:succinyl-CoA synthetase alpha subunit
MPILVDRSKSVLVQGITGREGTVRTKYMLEYGTKVVAGCAPGRGGSRVHDVPVYSSVAEAVGAVGPLDISVIFVPGPQAKSAALEAIASGIPLVAVIADRVPLYDVLEICWAAMEQKVSIVGPNSAGFISPDVGVVGMIGGSARAVGSWLHAGPVGVASRSGGMGVATAYYLSQKKVGVSSLVHVGGDAVVGMGLHEAALRFEQDEQTKVMVVIGEVGTSQEEQLAELMIDGKIRKPVIVFIGGRAAREGMRYSHAGALVEGGRGSYASKYEVLKRAGARIAQEFSQIPDIVRGCL